ncbi:PucR family transcriptional regulator [Actinomadura craniellae]|uniref:PucR family transcriptional regulator n=1 Tax=Actinomadura craniellae TaxID=2231787 RepID=UPI001F30CF09|nr:helix-turn-helix domain-containing protein [Actinomadura craniellae]
MRRLSTRLPEVTDRLVAEILDDEERECSARLRRDLWQACRSGLERGIQSILDPDNGRADLRWAEAVGQWRAEQGLPLDWLLRLYRVGGYVFWQSVVEIVSAEDPEHVPALVRYAAQTWEAIDQQSTAATEAYHRTEYDLLRRSEERVNAVLDALLEGRGDGGLPAAAMTVLGLPAQGRYAVVVLAEDVPVRPAPSLPHAGTGLRFIWRVRADGTVGLVSMGGAGLDELAAAIGGRIQGNAGISPVVGDLADVGRARWLAELALRTCTAAGAEVARLDRRLPGALVVSQPDIAHHLHREVFGSFAGLEPGLRDTLIETLACWLELDGSTAEVARRLYCHRNTVLNRLRRIEQLTGRLLARPADLVEITLALNALRLAEEIAEPAGGH